MFEKEESTDSETVFVFKDACSNSDTTEFNGVSGMLRKGQILGVFGPKGMSLNCSPKFIF